MVNDVVHHFSAGGLYNGLVLLTDDESRSHWDHITGAAVHGPLRGAQLDAWPIEMTNVGAVMQVEPELPVFVSRLNLAQRLFTRIARRMAGKLFPPGFRRTMGERDARLAEMEIGLGVVVGHHSHFYPTSTIGQGLRDTIEDRELSLSIGELDQVPIAVWADDGSRPMQLFTRWYGFSHTFPDCEIYGAPQTGLERESCS